MKSLNTVANYAQNSEIKKWIYEDAALTSCWDFCYFQVCIFRIWDCNSFISNVNLDLNQQGSSAGFRKQSDNNSNCLCHYFVSGPAPWAAILQLATEMYLYTYLGKQKKSSLKCSPATTVPNYITVLYPVGCIYFIMWAAWNIIIPRNYFLFITYM